MGLVTTVGTLVEVPAVNGKTFGVAVECTGKANGAVSRVVVIIGS